MLAGGTVYGVVSRGDILNWLLPICLQFVVPISILVATPFLPESPRWLAGQNRLEDATTVLRGLRKETQYTDEQIYAEVLEIQASYNEDRDLYQGIGWANLFKGANLRRTLIAIGLQSLQQAQGVSFAANYVVVLLQSLGINNVYTVALCLNVVMLVSSLGAFYFPDRIGRRTCECVSMCRADGSAPHRFRFWCQLDGDHWIDLGTLRVSNWILRQLLGRLFVPLDSLFREHLVTHPLGSCCGDSLERPS